MSREHKSFMQRQGKKGAAMSTAKAGHGAGGIEPETKPGGRPPASFRAHHIVIGQRGRDLHGLAAANCTDIRELNWARQPALVDSAAAGQGQISFEFCRKVINQQELDQRQEGLQQAR